jgi:hypothetical protein
METWRRVAIANTYVIGVIALVTLFPHPLWLAVWVASILLYPVGGGLANLGYRYWNDVSLVGLVTFVTILGALIAHLGPIQAFFGVVYVGIALVAVNYFAMMWTPDPIPSLTLKDRLGRRRDAFRGGGAVGLVMLVTWGFFAVLLTIDFLFRGRWQVSPLGIPLLPVLLFGMTLMLIAYLSERRAKSAGP